jgi:hypothetical protein
VSDREEIWIVDRFEGERAVLERALHEMLEVPRALLPARAQEGDALRVTIWTADGESRLSIVRDEAETHRRAGEAGRILQDLKRRDPGGDVKL